MTFTAPMIGFVSVNLYQQYNSYCNFKSVYIYVFQFFFSTFTYRSLLCYNIFFCFLLAGRIYILTVNLRSSSGSLPSSEWCMSSLLMPSEKRVPAVGRESNRSLFRQGRVTGCWSRQGQRHRVTGATGYCLHRGQLVTDSYRSLIQKEIIYRW